MTASNPFHVLMSKFQYAVSNDNDTVGWW